MHTHFHTSSPLGVGIPVNVHVMGAEHDDYVVYTCTDQHRQLLCSLEFRPPLSNPQGQYGDKQKGRESLGEYTQKLGSDVGAMLYRNLVIFRVENISYVIISCSFNFVRSRYHI